MKHRHIAYSVLLAAILSACGGGETAPKSNESTALGSPSEVDPGTMEILAAKGASPATGLLISEVSRTDYPSQPGWFEIYNASNAPIDLSTVMVRSGSCNYDNACDATQGKLFTLPAVNLVSKGFIVVGGQPAADITRENSVQQISLRDSAGTYPYWQSASGFIELVSANKTLDFVRFGSSKATPLTSGAWSGSNVPAIDSSSSNYDRVLARAIPSATKPPVDTNAANDWALVNWSTPAGQNDVLASAKDADKDGIPDSAETKGGTYAGIDLYAMGARTNKRDIFVEVDYMPSTDPASTPRKEALDKVAAAFAKRGIAVHFDAGNLYGQAPNSGYNLGGGNALPVNPCLTLRDRNWGFMVGGWCSASIYGYKRGNFDARRQPVFHYLVMALSQREDGLAGSSGVAEMPGNDLVVTLGGWKLNTDTEATTNTLINFQAGTIMHELGHNLGLHHGGNDEYNYKPNYYSVMNYLYQMYGLAADPSDWGGLQRYMLTVYWPDRDPRKPAGVCELINSPCSKDFILDYSDGISLAMNENKLDETKLIGRGAKPGVFADWNYSGKVDRSVFVDLSGEEMYTTLTDFNDWSNIRLDVRDDFEHVSGTTQKANTVRKQLPGTQDESAQASEESAPTERFLEQIRAIR